MDRLLMASALVARARVHKDWIGDDHGDRYETTMQTGVVSDEMQIVVKELLDHLRAALDYCAHQAWRHFSGQPSGAKIYFPIAKEGFKESDFPSLINRQMPGVAAVSSKAYQVFRGFQSFADDKNAWLPELATLVNQTKHDHLEVASMPETIMNIARHDDGALVMSFAPGHGPKRGKSPWMMLKADSSILEAGGACQAVFLQLKDIGVELSAFLREAIDGTGLIVDECRHLISSETKAP
ncbi:hypothetical protein F9L06_13490 [Brucella anthropi]|uniref:Uncharacterized protein n=1 Tax=Brucella anthropi TaxID=529 RepID=A0A6I0DL75_BRUAN|nr:hypothetical protein [Brucella anthropi]KAB2797338.1 hypothetical protein F9L06_13490 [Brucella anthropi]